MKNISYYPDAGIYRITGETGWSFDVTEEALEAARANTARQMTADLVANGVITPNDARALFGLKPLEHIL